MNKNKKYAIIIILVSNAIIISLLESIIPVPIPVPGVKLGLANIITLIALVFLAFKDVMLIVIIRCFVVALLTRGIMMLAFSLSGGIISALIMIVLYKTCSRFLVSKASVLWEPYSIIQPR
jgi:heptaprenyl diphosphate synthase